MIICITYFTSEQHDQNKPMQWFFDTNIHQWILVPQISDPRLMPPPQGLPNRIEQQSTHDLSLLTKSNSAPGNMNINLSVSDNKQPVPEPPQPEPVEEKESLESKIKKYLLAGAVSPTSSNLLIKSGLSPTLDNKLSISSSSVDKPAENLGQKLPPNWKSKKNDKGLNFIRLN